MAIIKRGGNGGAMVRNILMGVTGLALTAGAIGAGAALASRKNRSLLKRRAKNVLRGVTDMARNLSMPESQGSSASRRMPAVAHRLSFGKRINIGKLKRGGRGKIRGRRRR